MDQDPFGTWDQDPFGTWADSDAELSTPIFPVKLAGGGYYEFPPIFPAAFDSECGDDIREGHDI